MNIRSLLTILATFASPAAAWAQTAVPPAAPATVPAAPATAPATSTAGDTGSTLVVIGLIAGLLVLVGIGVKLFDLKRKRTAEAVHLQAQVSDALLREESLVGLAITPTAHVPYMGKGAATIEVTGTIDNPGHRERALRVVRDEAMRIRPDVEVVDHIQVRERLERAA